MKRTRWLWLINRQNLTAGQQCELVWLTRPSLQLVTARAHRWREDFQTFYDQPADQAEAYRTFWCAGAMRSRLQPIQGLRRVKRHWDGVIAWHHSHLTTGLLEGPTPSSRPPKPERAATATRNT